MSDHDDAAYFADGGRLAHTDWEPDPDPSSDDLAAVPTHAEVVASADALPDGFIAVPKARWDALLADPAPEGLSEEDEAQIATWERNAQRCTDTELLAGSLFGALGMIRRLSASTEEGT